MAGTTCATDVELAVIHRCDALSGIPVSGKGRKVWLIVVSRAHALLAVDYKPYNNRNKGFSVLSFSTTYYWLAIKLLLPCRWPVIDHLLAVCWSYIDVILAIHRLRLTAQIAEKSEDLEIKMLYIDND